MTTEQNANTTEATGTATETATPKYFLGLQGDVLRAYQSIELFKADFKDGTAPITSVDELVASDVPLAAIVATYNKGADKKVRGFKDRAEGSKELFTLLDGLAAKAAANAGKSEADKLASAVKPAKVPKAPKEKKEGSGEGRSSPLSGKFWSRSGKALVGRRIGGTGVGIQALQHIINNPGVSTEDYLKNSGGGRLVDLQYDYDKGNIVMLDGDEAARKTQIDALAKDRAVAEKAAAEAAEKAAADKKAKEEKAAADKKAKEEKAAADKAAKEAEAAKAAAPAEGEAAKA